MDDPRARQPVQTREGHRTPNRLARYASIGSQRSRPSKPTSRSSALREDAYSSTKERRLGASRRIRGERGKRRKRPALWWTSTPQGLHSLPGENMQPWPIASGRPTASGTPDSSTIGPCATTLLSQPSPQRSSNHRGAMDFPRRRRLSRPTSSSRATIPSWADLERAGAGRPTTTLPKT